MLGHADGFLAPCLWGDKEKKSAYLLFNEGFEDVIINSRYITQEMVKRGGRVRVFGTFTLNKGFRELSADRFIELN